MGLGGVGVDWLLTQLRAQNTAISVSSSATVQSASINIFRTPYFQFQADKSWSEISSPDQEGKRFIYRSFNGAIVQHELIVDIDGKNAVVLDNTQVTRVLPVEIANNTLKAVGGISPHCQTIDENRDSRDQYFAVYKEASFPCNPDGSSFIAVVSLIGGDETITRTLDSGEVRTYNITYRDSTFSPSGQPLNNIINTFQLL